MISWSGDLMTQRSCVLGYSDPVEITGACCKMMLDVLRSLLGDSLCVLENVLSWLIYVQEWYLV